MFEGYLELGGGEVLNSARAVGYMTSASCPTSWLQCAPCPGLRDVLGDDPYTYETVFNAPWYDPDDPNTGRFLGAYALTAEGVTDSTRDASVAEGITDGGVVGRVRHATRRMRYRALLSAQGEDALELGLSWLKAALTPGKCSTHADACGASDMQFLTACPPERSEVTNPFPVWKTQVTNLATNPSMETAGASVEVTRNHCLNPSFETGVLNWTQANGGSNTMTRISTEKQVGSYSMEYRYGAASVADSGPVPTHSLGTLQIGEKVTFSAYLKPGSPVPGGALRLFAFGPAISNATIRNPVSGAAGWTRHSMTITATAVGTITFAIGTNTGGQPNQVFYVDGVMIEKAPAARAYFDGATPAAGDFTYAWTGTAHASASAQSGLQVAGYTPGESVAIQSTRWARDRTKSMQIVSKSLNQGSAYVEVAGTGAEHGLEVGHTYTMHARVWMEAARGIASTPALGMVADNGTASGPGQDVAGEQTLSMTFTIPATGAWHVRMYNGGAASHGDVWFDAVTIVEGQYGGQYFDGMSPDSSDADLVTMGKEIHAYDWLGAADASASVWNAGVVEPQEDPVAYQAEVERLVRNMHAVTCVAGPTIEQKLHRGEMWGYIVEFVLVAGVPWMFSVTKPLPKTPSVPVVIQDTPFNLVPYPSAELAGANVVVAKNFVTNPSVETVIDGWGVLALDGSGNPLSGAVLTRSTELASAGSASAKVLLTAPVAGSNGWILTEQYVELTGITPTTRYSFNLWASASVESGTAVLGTLELITVWYNGATYLGETSQATQPATGGAMSVKSILPPPGTTRVLLRSRLRLTSWSAGAKIRVYTDAAAVTVP